jgi:hypothetical protein
MKNKIIVFFFLFSFNSFSQVRYESPEHKEFTIVLPGEVYFNSTKDVKVPYEEFYNDDFELVLTVYSGYLYEYLPDLSEEVSLSADALQITEARKFLKGSMSNIINYEFYIGFSKNYNSNVIFGIIQDSFSRKLYEVELYCLNLNLNNTTEIINSIQIDKYTIN